jgi:hypothetical protein
MIVLLPVCQALAAPTGCAGKPGNGVELLRAYSEKNGNTPDIFSVAAMGNQNFMLDEDYLPETPQEAATLIQNAPAYATATRVLLVWPYSTMGGTFAPALQALLHKPVIGFSGPLWWYPDGTAIATDPTKSTDRMPSAANVSECLTGDGKYHTGAACVAIVKKHHADKAVFGNVAFQLSCDEIQTLGTQAQKADAEANLRLYFFHYFVNVDYSSAIKYLSRAASLGDPTANYFVALSLKSNPSPAVQKLYRSSLKLAADGGIEKAKTELELSMLPAK